MPDVGEQDRESVAVDVSTPPGPRRMQLVARALLVAWVALLVASIPTTERASSLAELESAVAAGEVTRVEASEGLPPESRGYATVGLRWRDGASLRTASVIEARPLREARDESGGLPRLRAGALEDRLAALDPDVRVQRVPGLQVGAQATLWGRGVPGPFLWAWLVLLLATWWVLFRSSEPHHATRPAWFWITLLVPGGVLAFLVAGGASGLVPPPRAARARLTGGWAFLGSMLLAGALGAG